MATVFTPFSPLHDGAVVVRGDTVMAAGCLLPLSKREGLEKELGTRHRAAIGISEETDCVVVVVSEETGKMSIAIGGKLTRNLDDRSLKRVLKNLFVGK